MRYLNAATGGNKALRSLLTPAYLCALFLASSAYARERPGAERAPHSHVGASTRRHPPAAAKY